MPPEGSDQVFDHRHNAAMRDVPIGLQRTELAHLLEVSDVGGAGYEPR